MIQSFLDNLNHWSWWVLALVLIIVETLLPGVVFLWLGIAAGIVGMIVLFAPDLGWEIQFSLFAVLSVVSVVVGRMIVRRHPTPSQDSMLNQRGLHYVGRSFTLEEPIIDGFGKLRVDDTTWKIEGANQPAGGRVRVIGVDGVVLKVAPDSDDGVGG